MRKTMQALITDVQRELYQSAGPGVQVYAQDRIQALIQQAFEHCYKAKWWPQYRKREVRALDGTTGQVTVPFAYIKAWDDVKHVFRRGSDRPLPILPASFNTSDLGTTSEFARYVEATDDENLFTIYPISATSNIEVVGRRTYDVPFVPTDVVPFEYLPLVHFAAWTYFIDDASNPPAALRHQGLYEKAMKEFEDASLGHAVELNPNSGYVPDRWYES